MHRLRVRRFKVLGVRVGAGGGGDLADDDDRGRQRRGAAEGGGGVPELANQHLKASVSRGIEAESPTHNCTAQSIVTAQSQHSHSTQHTVTAPSQHTVFEQSQHTPTTAPRKA